MFAGASRALLASVVFAQWRAGEFSSRPVVTLGAAETVGEALRRLANVAHQGFPVVDAKRGVVGVVMRRALVAASPRRSVAELIERPPVMVHASDTLRHAADVMATPASAACRCSPTVPARRW